MSGGSLLLPLPEVQTLGFSFDWGLFTYFAHTTNLTTNSAPTLIFSGVFSVMSNLGNTKKKRHYFRGTTEDGFTMDTILQVLCKRVGCTSKSNKRNFTTR